VFAGTSGGGAFRTMDEGASWMQVNTGLSDDFVRSFAINSIGHIFAGTAFVGVYRSTDGGESWNTTGLRSDWDFRSLAVNSSGHIFAGGWGGGVFRSTDNGATWLPVNAGLTDPVIEYLAINSSNHIFAATRNGGVFQSTDNGGNWLPINTGLTDLDVRCLAIDSVGYIFAGTASGGVFRSAMPTTSVKKIAGGIPSEFSLKQNYPNPFNAATKIQFSLPGSGYVTLRAFDTSGEEVATLISENLPAGTYIVEWRPDGLASGTYFYRLRASGLSRRIGTLSGQAGDYIETKKLILLK
ncbi:MAG: T9SS type A sorting domain-containing protein, partial [Bacteroidota bacterium]